MAEVVKNCCIHSIDDNNDNIISFTSETLYKCKKILDARKLHRLNLSNFTLPESISEAVGYHPKCYRAFTAIKSKHLTSIPPDSIMSQPSTSFAPEVMRKKRCRRSREISTSSSGIFKKACIICEKVTTYFNRQKQSLILCTTRNFERKFSHAAEILEDEVMLGKINGLDLIAKELRYHRVCALRYIAKSRRTLNRNQGRWHLVRELHVQAFAKLYSFIQLHVLEREQVFTKSELFRIFKNQFEELLPDGMDEYSLNTKPSYVEHRILTNFAGQLYVDKSVNDHIIFKASMNFIPSVVNEKLEFMKKQSQLMETAHILRQSIKKIIPAPLTDGVTSSTIINGECRVPTILYDFVSDVVNGPSGAATFDRRVDSIAQDLIFSTTNGRIKPEKHLTLGVGVKSLTGSKKMVNILNRLGHCCSYSTVEEIETELSYGSCEVSTVVPAGISAVPNLSTGVAFDNFDRFVETSSGKNTLHDTVGIIYQIARNHDHQTGQHLPLTEETPSANTGRRRRTFEALLDDVEPYSKRETPSFKIRGILPCIECTDYRAVDILWCLSVNHSIPNTPMWMGFHAQRFEDGSPIQKIAYLPQINSSPTSYSVVAHTLKMSQSVARECSQQQIICTYDLAIAKMALQIQEMEKPVYDNVFIMLGTFHIELAFFKALGKMVDGSGLQAIIEEAGIIAPGSVNGFINGTNYNRCRKNHEMIALVLRILHIRAFKERISSTTSASDDHDDPSANEVNAGNSTTVHDDISQLELTDDEIVQLLEETTHIKIDPNFQSNINVKLSHYIAQYLAFEEKTLKGEHGATAQFWITYVRYMDIYHDLIRSIRICDIELYVNTLIKITNLFFALNHHNYSRWLVVFVEKLMDTLGKNDEITLQLKQGLFSIRRSSKPFCRTPVDLTLEQTINADAGNKLTGVSAFTNSISARQRWAISHSERTEILSHLMQKAGLTGEEDTAKDLRPHNMKNNIKTIDRMLMCFTDALNPFSISPDHELYNISTGKATKNEIKSFLLHLFQFGETQHLKFRKECEIDPHRFNRPITKNKILNFCSDNVVLKLKKIDKSKEIVLERNLFARLLTLSLQHNIDLGVVFSYPLTPVPLALCHPNGVMMKTSKSQLFRHLESLVSHSPPEKIDVVVIDGLHFLHRFSNNLPSTFGAIAEYLLKKLWSFNVKKIYVIFDTYKTPSIKDLEWSQRSENAPLSKYTIANALQKRPNNFLQSLRNQNFKEALIGFLMNHWKDLKFAHYFERFSLFCNQNEKMFCFLQNDNSVASLQVPSLTSHHIEADSKIVFVLTKIETGNVVVKAEDTDIVVIILGNIQYFKPSVKVWMETGTAARNNVRLIDVTSIYNKIGSKLSAALPAFHALTGSDYTASFHRLGKIKPLQVLSNQQESVDILSRLGEKEFLEERECKELEKLVCYFYSKKGNDDVNDLRLNMFLDAYKKKKNVSFKVPKGINGSSMPPCSRVLRQKFLRTKFVAGMWTQLHQPNPQPWFPENFGWVLEHDSYHIKWHHGPQLPERLEEIVFEEKEDDRIDDETSNTESSDDDDDE